ncbi:MULTISPECIES: c-type cytochrome [Methylobacillus]|uniref:Cytochrome c, MxaG family n=1 Tax=Methylobacillus flagellatus (strain ATCC 51484 / DSM 6875 / VKM B-1610 / KT) TaxID=265072 RepID=Q1GYV8_METFK|nr:MULTISPECIES: c-type cytochrome [Methylobacillus]ABE50579.1 Cytochrome c, MxaG family [Methylobacillus flagellatus KT]MPS50031.1 cytochrome C [Methylobacillus sp.]
MLNHGVIKATLAASVLALAGLAMPMQASAACNLVSTKDNSPLNIKVEEGDTPEAKEFLETCVNPYTKIYVEDPNKAKQGKRKFGLYSCTTCHGPNGDGQVAVSITDDRWQYSKHITDKGLFETIAGGTNGGMAAWHKQVANNPDLVTTDEILKIIGFLRSQYKGGGDKPWLNEKPQK